MSFHSDEIESDTWHWPRAFRFFFQFDTRSVATIRRIFFVSFLESELDPTVKWCPQQTTLVAGCHSWLLPFANCQFIGTRLPALLSWLPHSMWTISKGWLVSHFVSERISTVSLPVYYLAASAAVRHHGNGEGRLVWSHHGHPHRRGGLWKTRRTAMKRPKLIRPFARDPSTAVTDQQINIETKWYCSFDSLLWWGHFRWTVRKYTR